MTNSVEERLASFGVTLPPPPQPKGSYVPVVEEGGFAWVAGQLPLVQGQLLHKGLVDTDVPLADAQECARQATLSALAALKAALGDLDRIRRVVRVGVFVASSPNFTSQPAVANGASDLLVAAFGEAGKHARVAVGTARLPLDSPVEVELLVAVK
jgi:enamine deaminase RidA (YjgF/YER057c/UK114 family)